MVIAIFHVACENKKEKEGFEYEYILDNGQEFILQVELPVASNRKTFDLEWLDKNEALQEYLKEKRPQGNFAVSVWFKDDNYNCPIN